MLNAKTGEVLNEEPLKEKGGGEQGLLNCFIDKKNSQLITVGEYYAPGKKVLADKSTGLYIRKFDLEGKELSYTKFAWDKEIAKLRKGSASPGDKDDRNSLYFHKFILAEDGKLFGVAEEFRITASALGIAGAVLGGNGSNKPATIQATVTDMVIVEFSADLKLTNYTQVPKKKTRVLLPSGAEFWSKSMIGQYVKYQGSFDYSFTSSDRSLDSYEVMYIDFNKEDEAGEKADKMLGVLSIKGGDVTTSRIPLNFEKRTAIIMPAKPGYINIVEYYRKERKINSHLERIAE